LAVLSFLNKFNNLLIFLIAHNWIDITINVRIIELNMIKRKFFKFYFN